MQQSSATPKNKDVGRGLRKIVACSQPYLAVLSCIYSFWHGVIPTSYFIFNDFLHLFHSFFPWQRTPWSELHAHAHVVRATEVVTFIYIRIFTYVRTCAQQSEVVMTNMAPC